MTSRERVLLALGHQEADRVPIHDSVWESTTRCWHEEGLPVDSSPAVGPEQSTGASQLERAGGLVRPGDIVLLQTGFNDMHFNTPFNLKYTPGLTLEAAKWLVDRQVKTLAIDFPSVEIQTAYGLPTGEIHCYLWQYDIPIIEYLGNLHLLRKKRFFRRFLTSSDSDNTRLCTKGTVEEW